MSELFMDKKAGRRKSLTLFWLGFVYLKITIYHKTESNPLFWLYFRLATFLPHFITLIRQL